MEKGQRDYQESLNFLYRLEKYGMVFGLTQVEKILESLGNPHREIQVVHIGGTNGKGSTAAMMASILKQEGYRVGLYTSPHLIDFTERIQVNGARIGTDEVAALTEGMREKVKETGDDAPFTFFDFTTAMAFLYFSQKRVDLAMVEAGLGGRLDSTNVVDPLLVIITNISRDHEDVLGKGILKIAREKAGMIKPRRPLITGATQPKVLRLFSKICDQKGCPCYRVGREFCSVWNGEREFHYEGIHRKLWGIHLNLFGPHQILNAVTALGGIEILEELGYPVSTPSILEGLRSVDWPGRLEMIQSTPRVILDGAHNPAGALALRESLLKEFRFRHLILLIGILKDKDIPAILRSIAPLADHIILSRPRVERAALPSSIREALGRNRRKAEVIENPEEAIARGLSLTEEEDLLCITGSLYLVGEARAYFRAQEKS